MDDGKIVELFFARSEQAIEELAAKYGAIIERVAYNVLGNRQDAEECVNSAYLAVWNTVPPQKPDPLLSYVCRIVRNLALKKYHENTALKRNSIYDVALDELSGCLPAAACVEDALAAKEISGMINGFLATLDRQSRVMFVRRCWYADSIEDIAAALGKSRHYVSVRLSRIRKALKQYLETEGITV